MLFRPALLLTRNPAIPGGQEVRTLPRNPGGLNYRRGLLLYAAKDEDGSDGDNQSSQSNHYPHTDAKSQRKI